MFFTLLRKLKSFLRLPLFEKLLIPIVFILLGFARLAILTIPFRYYARLLGIYQQADIFIPLLTTEQAQWANRIGRVIRSTATITPWQSLCLVQALVASCLLRLVQIPYVLHFGLANNVAPDASDPMKAHAWVSAGMFAITGGRSLFKFTVVGTYVSPIYINKQR
jgi:hypothetical protein